MSLSEIVYNLPPGIPYGTFVIKTERLRTDPNLSGPKLTKLASVLLYKHMSETRGIFTRHVWSPNYSKLAPILSHSPISHRNNVTCVNNIAGINIAKID